MIISHKKKKHNIEVKNFNYLGTTLEDKGTMAKEIKGRIEKNVSPI